MKSSLMRWLATATTAALPVALALCIATAAFAKARTEESVRKWREDLAYLSEKLIEIHPEPFHSLPRERFERMLQELGDGIPRMPDEQIILGISRILASLGQGDGHSGINLAHAHLGLRFVPLGFYHFSDGVFIRAAAAEYQGAVGSRLVAIDGVPIDEVLPRILEITEGDNAMTKRARSVRALAIPEVLHALGIAKQKDSVAFTLRARDGSESTIRPKTRSFQEPVEWAGEERASSPLYLRNASTHPYDPHQVKANFWYQYLPEEKLLYVNYSAVAPSEHETVGDFFGRVFAFADKNPVEKFVLDIRNNGGGNNFFNRPIFYGLIKRDETIARPGHLFVIIGRNTFSAAQNLATMLDIHTSAIFVGEPTGGSPNHFGDAETVTLPNSGLPVRVASLRWQDSDPRDRRPWIPPDVAVDLSAGDYFAGRDRALQAVRTYEKQHSIAERLRPAVLRAGKPAAAEALRAFRSDPRHRYAEIEAPINRLGYELLREKNLPAAIAIFEINTEAFPESWNVWDSLGEAYAAAGRRDEAIRAYERALQLNPRAGSASHALQRLRTGS